MTNHHSTIARQLSLSLHQVKAVLELLGSGATIPFIARYRKEATGSLDEVAIARIQDLSDKLQQLDKRREYIIETISTQGKLTESLRAKILAADSAEVLEDLFLPYMQRRRTRAKIARDNGLEPLARLIASGRLSDAQRQARPYVNDNVIDETAAIDGACDIIAEDISQDADTREHVRKAMTRTAHLTCSIPSSKTAEADNYANYDKFDRSISRVSSHQYLAMARGHEAGLLKLSIKADDDTIVSNITRRFTPRNATGESARLLARVAADSYKRLIRPSVETLIHSRLKEQSDETAISLFADNLRELLMAPPLSPVPIMAIDPGFRTGCKLVVINPSGALLYHTVIYPNQPTQRLDQASATVKSLIDRYNIGAIAIGSGTASRETRSFIDSLALPEAIKVFIVDESGASIYSASEVARQEFPDQDITVRGAVSIGRRLLDPLAELIKIDPRSIGVGQYQHDVNQSRLKQSLDMTVTSCVNSVGVDINTASPQLLTYISGIGPSLARAIIDYRDANGQFTSRAQLLKVPRLGAKAYEQCAGFIRVPSSAQPLDNTAVHPESYDLVQLMAKDLGVTINQLINDSNLISSIDLNRYVDDHRGLPTLRDIIAELLKPGRDPRTEAANVEFAPTITSIEDLTPGMILNGVVRNITAFGAFVDIGIKQSGLIHLSQMSENYIKSPNEVVHIGQHLTVKVLDIDYQRGRIALTLRFTH